MEYKNEDRGRVYIQKQDEDNSVIRSRRKMQKIISRIKQ